ncbi:hypothetical protein PO909_027992, partial [Leuciscus waleckii]
MLSHTYNTFVREKNDFLQGFFPQTSFSASETKHYILHSKPQSHLLMEVFEGQRPSVSPHILPFRPVVWSLKSVINKHFPMSKSSIV